MPGGFELCPPTPIDANRPLSCCCCFKYLAIILDFFLILRISAQNYSVNFLKHAYFMVAPGRDDPVK